MKIVVCIPHSYKVFNKQFALSLLTLISHFHIWNGDRGKKHELNILVQNTGWIDHMREQLAEKAIASGATHLMWLDTDMTFPPDLIPSMIRRFEDNPTLEAVTGLYTWKKPPFLPHIYSSYNEDVGTFNYGAGFPLDETFSVAGAGFGCIMTTAELFKRVEKPWFKMEMEGEKIKIGEDLFFCRKAQPINMICDPTISCLHLVETGFDIDAHIKYNNITVTDGFLDISDKQIKSVAEEHLNEIK